MGESVQQHENIGVAGEQCDVPSYWFVNGDVGIPLMVCYNPYITACVVKSPIYHKEQEFGL